MELLNRIGKQLTKAGQDVAHQTKTIAEITRLTAILYDMEKKLNTSYAEFGKEVYSRGDYPQDEELLKRAHSIASLTDEIREKKEQVEKLKQVVKEKERIESPCCESSIDEKGCSCNGSEANAKAEMERKCPNCGQSVGNEAIFCIFCGAKMESEDVSHTEENTNTN